MSELEAEDPQQQALSRREGSHPLAQMLELWAYLEDPRARLRPAAILPPADSETQTNGATMSEQAHTPGPWGYTYDGSSTWSIGPAADPQVDRVATIFGTRNNDAICRANARLMAAAPELLAALKALLSIDEVRHVWDAGAIGDGEGWQSSTLSNAIYLGDEAIRKAEHGEGGPIEP